jgi:hypothetical protein
MLTATLANKRWIFSKLDLEYIIDMFPVFGRIDWQLYLLARVLSFASQAQGWQNYVALLCCRSISLLILISKPAAIYTARSV